MELSGRGRRKQYCSRSCRQRAYEKRAGVGQGASRPVAQAETGRIGDGLFEIRCLAEDLQQALADGADTATVSHITEELIVTTRSVERLLP